MAHSLKGSRLKVRRANDHLVALNRRVERFIKSDSYSLFSDYDAETREHVVRLRVVKYPRLDRWALIVGDIVHNLRSALDHIVWEATVLHQGGPPPFPVPKGSIWNGIEFPIFFECDRYLYGGRERKPSKDRFPHGSGLYKIRGVDPRLHTLFEGLQPFRDRQRRYRNVLLVLHELDLIDKHRRIPVLFSVVVPHEVPVGRGPFLDNPWLTKGVRLNVEKVYPPGPFKDGTKLARVSQSGVVTASSYAVPMYMEPKLSFDIQFEKGRPTMGLPVFPTLAAMMERVDEILDLFETNL